ncbi:hypothetical protein [Pantoea nemavictus]|uniref:Uncharacterized protein n=1 Tax=Pantoea nemavictus TaxID=2726955 RepID=A0ABU8PYP0_9GAMM|nr:hypothetical protein [Pantoea nemavictus]
MEKPLKTLPVFSPVIVKAAFQQPELFQKHSAYPQVILPDALF